MSGIYPISDAELDAAIEALDNAIDGCASLTSCVHAVLGAIDRLRTTPEERLIRTKHGVFDYITGLSKETGVPLNPHKVWDILQEKMTD